MHDHSWETTRRTAPIVTAACVLALGLLGCGDAGSSRVDRRVDSTEERLDSLEARVERLERAALADTASGAAPDSAALSGQR